MEFPSQLLNSFTPIPQVMTEGYQIGLREAQQRLAEQQLAQAAQEQAQRLAEQQRRDQLAAMEMNQRAALESLQQQGNIAALNQRANQFNITSLGDIQDRALRQREFEQKVAQEAVRTKAATDFQNAVNSGIDPSKAFLQFGAQLSPGTIPSLIEVGLKSQEREANKANVGKAFDSGIPGLKLTYDINGNAHYIKDPSYSKPLTDYEKQKVNLLNSKIQQNQNLLTPAAKSLERAIQSDKESDFETKQSRLSELYSDPSNFIKQTVNSAGTVQVETPDGKVWTISQDKVGEAIKRGARLLQ